MERFHCSCGVHLCLAGEMFNCMFSFVQLGFLYTKWHTGCPTLATRLHQYRMATYNLSCLHKSLFFLILKQGGNSNIVNYVSSFVRSNLNNGTLGCISNHVVVPHTELVARQESSYKAPAVLFSWSSWHAIGSERHPIGATVYPGARCTSLLTCRY